MAFSVYTSDGDTTSVEMFTINDSTGTKIYKDGVLIRGWYLLTEDKVPFWYSDAVDGDYMPIYSGEFTGSFKNGEGRDTIGWIKSNSGTVTLYVLFIY